MRFAPGLPIDCSKSTAVYTLKLNPLTGSVRVRFHSTWATQYKLKASRRAMLPLLWYSGDKSIGQWVNRNCLQNHVTISY